jgi:hypothetical protein
MREEPQMTTTSATTDRTLYGCPAWCRSDHASRPHDIEVVHVRRLGQLGETSIALVHCAEWDDRPAPQVELWLTGNDDSLKVPATRETVERLRDLALMLKRASDEMAGLLVAGELS